MQRIAIIGCGRVANHIAQFFQKGLTGASVLFTCDLDIERAQQIAQKTGGTAVSDIKTVLAHPDVDVVLILTESGKHTQHARQALLAGKHVIVEKPVGLIPNEVYENIELSKQQKRMYAVIKQNRWNPAMQQLKQTMDDGRFGKLVMGSIRLIWCREQEYYNDGWHGTWEMDGGVISQQAIHHIDALQWICGPIESVVSAQTNAINSLEAEDTTVGLVRFKNGAVGTITATTAARPEDQEASISVVGSEGLAEVGGIALNTITHWKFANPIPEDESTPSTYSEVVPNGYGLSHGPILQEIFDRLNAGRLDAPVSASDALASVEIIHALYKSAEIGTWVRVGTSEISSRLGKPHNS
ncbi:Gfo/Idh/MocA family oxidoreductase [Candidatus Uhrbacteria bacterium]|nr:Gfo/Idh/MocA family oxidoreductase [Candidatus Uhrbacteria bacterium]